MQLLLEAQGARGEPKAVAFANAHTLTLARGQASYHRVLCRAWRVFADGVGVRLGVRLTQGITLQDNVNGTDVIPQWFGASEGGRVFLLGSTPDRVRRAASHVRATWPHWQVVGVHHGYLSPQAEPALCRAIRRARPQVLLVGMGNPLQEQWIDAHREILGVPLLVGVGALLDYWSGSLRRAPPLLRNNGLEWAYRLAFHKGKRRRYTLGSARFLGYVARDALWGPGG